MDSTMINALLQLPFVLVMVFLVQRFLGYLNERDAEWRAFMAETDERLATRMTELTQAVDRLSERMVYHDLAMRGRDAMRDDDLA